MHLNLKILLLWLLVQGCLAYYESSYIQGPYCQSTFPSDVELKFKKGDLQPIFEEVEEILEAEFKSYKTPSLSYAFVIGDELIHHKSFGYAKNSTTPTLASIDNVYRIGSITKSFTTLALFSLVEMGVVKFTDPVSKFFPDFGIQNPFNPKDNEITLHMLATYQSGLPREACVYDESAKRYACGFFVGKDHKPIFDALRDDKLFLPHYSRTPGYSNLGFALLGNCLDIAIKQDSGLAYSGYESFVTDYLAVKLGLDSTGFKFTDEIKKKFAYSESTRINDYFRFYNAGFTAPAGDMYASVRDLAKFTSFLLSGSVESPDHGILEKDSIRELTQGTTLLRDGSSATGYSFISLFTNGYWTVSKGGALVGYESIVAFIPDLNIGIAAASAKNVDLTSIPAKAFPKLVKAIESVRAQRAAEVYAGTYRFYYGDKHVDATVKIRDRDMIVDFSNEPNVDYVMVPNGKHAFYISRSHNSCMDQFWSIDAYAGASGINMEPKFYIQFTVADSPTHATALTLPSGEQVFKFLK
eukprot:TRINITY_DN178404_c1_g1_i1.p1 TRINITY_DN178404_c1_g1~~TRINITY_DN178404_c1_g1_i1.p1  ORF type:complete len:526 (-),score=134.96 TRINITY_DN178404_c1_g1_i1:1936-3513(-)